MLKTTLGAKDSYGSRQDMEEKGIRQELWLRPPQNRRDIFHMPPAPYILKSNGKVTMMDIVKKLRIPSNYVGAIHKCLADGRLRYMKSHNFHVLMHQVRIIGILFNYPVHLLYTQMMYILAQYGCLVPEGSVHC
jgi:hypothetical protein